MTFLSWSVLFIVLGRTLSLDDFGLIGFALAVGTLLALIPTYGFDLLIIRELSQRAYKVADIFGSIIFLKFVLTVISFFLLQLYIIYGSVSADEPLVFRLIWLSTAVLTYSNFFISIFKAEEDFETETLVVTFQTLCLLMLLTIVVSFELISATRAAWLILISNILGLLIAIVIFWKRFNSSKKPLIMNVNKLFVRKITKQGFPFAIQNFLGVAYFQFDIVLIGELLNVASVGYYQAAMRLITGFMRIPMIMINAFYPRIAQSFGARKEYVDLSTSHTLVHFMTWVGGLLTILFLVTAAPLITLLYTQKMTPAIPILRILSIVLVTRFIASGYGIILTSCHRQINQLMGAIVAVVINLSLNFLLIPTHGFLAAAWVSVITNAILLLLYAIFIKRALGTFLMNGLISFGKKVFLHNYQAL
jgi:O-antigen/teichoic acid export membrane protein